MTKTKFSRRQVLATAAATAAALAMPYVRGAHAAGKLSVGWWDHWVPGANNAMTALCKEWGEKNKVEVTIDYITSQGQKNLLTIAAEQQARSGHDILAMPTWQPIDKAKSLEPVDDVMEQLIKQNGDVVDTVKYLGRKDGHWVAVPATTGTQFKGPCSRIDYLKEFAGIDIKAMYPAGADPKADGWDMNAFVVAAEKCHAAGKPFGIGLGQTSDSIDGVGAFFGSFGANLVSEKGDTTVKTDAVRECMEYMKRLVKVLPADSAAWDDASNNKFLVSGQGSLILNPPSAWAVAKRDVPKIAEQCWTHGMPKGPAGRFGPFLPYFWGIWEFGTNKTAAKDLLVFLSQPEAVAKLVAASGGYDLPSFANLTKLDTWAKEGPPAGTLYHYPDPANQQVKSIAGAPAPANIAFQIYNQALQTKLVVRYAQGEKLDDLLSWAEDEIEGYSRS